MVAKWDSDADGMISRAEFLKEVKVLVPNAIASEIDDLFDSLDDDGGGQTRARKRLGRTSSAAAAAALLRCCVAALLPLLIPHHPTLPSPQHRASTSLCPPTPASSRRMSVGTGSLDIEEIKQSMKKLQAAAERAAEDEAGMMKAVTQLRKAARVAQDEVQVAKASDEKAFARKEAEAKEAERARAEAEAAAKALKAKARAERAAKAEEEKAAFAARVEEKRMRSA